MYKIPVWKHVPWELGGELYDADGKVGVVDVEVVGDAPHDDQVHPLLLQLPGQCARGSRKTEKYQLKILISLQTFNSNELVQSGSIY